MTIAPIKLRSRHALRDKDGDKLNAEIERIFGVRPLPVGTEKLIEKAMADPFELVLVEKKAFVVLVGLPLTGPLPTLRALMTARPERGWVTVDMGAVPYLRNGADVMAPGIVAADPNVKAGDLVWVRDEKHGMPLAVGQALRSGPEMAADDAKGKAIKSLHFVGDAIWTVGTETG